MSCLAVIKFVRYLESLGESSLSVWDRSLIDGILMLLDDSAENVPLYCEEWWKIALPKRTVPMEDLLSELTISMGQWISCLTFWIWLPGFGPLPTVHRTVWVSLLVPSYYKAPQYSIHLVASHPLRVIGQMQLLRHRRPRASHYDYELTPSLQCFPFVKELTIRLLDHAGRWKFRRYRDFAALPAPQKMERQRIKPPFKLTCSFSSE